MADDENTPANSGDQNNENPSDQGVPGPVQPVGQVVDLAIERELADSYLTYAMSTIHNRAHRIR